MSKLIPKKILITGATGGMGKPTLKLLLERGHTVVAAVRGGHARIECGDLPVHPGLSVVEFDLGKATQESLQNLSLFIQRKFDSQLDVLINAAGYGLFGPIELQTSQQIHEQMQVNFLGPIQLVKTVIPFLRTQKGRILNVTSMMAYTTFPFYGTYSASKFALHAVTEALFYELQPFGIQVASVEPGGYRTGFLDHIQLSPKDQPTSSLYEKRLKGFEGFRQMIRARLEEDPQVVARLMADLCEKRKIRSRYVVGLVAHMHLLLRRLLPDRTFVPMQSWIYQKFFF